MRKNRIGAIDVGTTKVCTIMADIDSSGGWPRILGVGVGPSQGLQKGLVVNIDEAKESIRNSVRKAERSAGYRMESAYVGITGRHVNSVNNRGVVSISRNDKLVRPDDLKRVLEIARSIKVPSDQRLLHVIPRQYMVDGQEGVKNPVGMHGFRLDVEAHIVTAAVTSIQNLTKCVRGVGVEIDDLVLESLASAEAVLTEEERQTGVLLADIGGGTTDICVIKEDTIYHTSILPVAGYQITRDVAMGLGLSFELAEEMKKRYGNVMPYTEEEENQDKDKEEEDKTITADGHTVSYNDLSEIIRIRVEEMLRLVMLELPHGDYAKMIPAGIVLTGGSANLPGIAELAQMLTRLPARVGTPINLYGVSDTLRDPAYATSVGLLMWRMKKAQGAQSWSKKEPTENNGGGLLNRLFGRRTPVANQ